MTADEAPLLEVLRLVHSVPATRSVMRSAPDLRPQPHAQARHRPRARYNSSSARSIRSACEPTGPREPRHRHAARRRARRAAICGVASGRSDLQRGRDQCCASTCSLAHLSVQRAVGTAIWHHANKCCELDRLDDAVRWWVLVEQPCLKLLPADHRGACLRKAALSRLHADDYESAIDLVGRSSVDPSRDASAQYILALVALLRGHEETGPLSPYASLTPQRCTL